jgi:hypothetical protein
LHLYKKINWRKLKFLYVLSKFNSIYISVVLFYMDLIKNNESYDIAMKTCIIDNVPMDWYNFEYNSKEINTIQYTNINKSIDEFNKYNNSFKNAFIRDAKIQLKYNKFMTFLGIAAFIISLTSIIQTIMSFSSLFVKSN